MFYFHLRSVREGMLRRVPGGEVFLSVPFGCQPWPGLPGLGGNTA